MKGKCMFRCQFGGRTFRVEAVKDQNKNGEVVFWTYEGRRILDPAPWLSLEGAVGSILYEQNVRFIANLRMVWG